MDKNESIEAMKSIMDSMGKQIVGVLKTETYKEAIDTVDNIEDMSKSEFESLVLERISVLGEKERLEVLNLIRKRIDEGNNGEALSLRKIILLDIQAMIRSNNFSKRYHNEMQKVNTENLLPLDDSFVVELTAAEILLLEYIDGCEIKLSLPGYFTYEYNIDYKSAFEKFARGGYIEYADIKYSLRKCSVPELKEILKSYHLKLTGKKDELVSRICSNIPTEELVSYEKKYFVVTLKGKNLLLENSHIKYFHSIKNKVQISIEEADRYKKQHKAASNVEIAFSLLEERMEKELSQKNWGMLRNTYYAKSVVCFYEKDGKQELEYLIDVCYMDKTLNERHNLSNPNFPLFADGIIIRIQSILQAEQINNEEFKLIFQSAVESFFKANAKYDVPFYKKDEEYIFENLSMVLSL